MEFWIRLEKGSCPHEREGEAFNMLSRSIGHPNMNEASLPRHPAHTMEGSCEPKLAAISDHTSKGLDNGCLDGVWCARQSNRRVHSRPNFAITVEVCNRTLARPGVFDFDGAMLYRKTQPIMVYR